MLLLAHPLIRREKMAPGSVQFSSILGYSFQCSTSVTWNFICCFGGYNSQFGMVFESCFISQCDALVICLLKWLRKKIHRYAEKLPVSMLNLGAFFVHTQVCYPFRYVVLAQVQRWSHFAWSH
jgi:hypothetical protein